MKVDEHRVQDTGNPIRHHEGVDNGARTHGTNRSGYASFDAETTSSGNKDYDITAKMGSRWDQVDIENPTDYFSGFDPETMGIISIVGIVMSLVAKASSNFWASLWQQASESMKIALELAPLSAKAVKDAAYAEAAATKEEANKSMYRAIVGGVMIGVTAFGTYSALSKQGKMPGENGPNARNHVDGNGAANAQNGADKAAEGLNQASSQGGGLFNFVTWANRFHAAGESAKLPEILNATSGHAIGTYYDGKKAGHQEDQGTENAKSKLVDQLMQFFTQLFNRSQEQTPHAQDMINRSVDLILKLLADRLSGVQHMFSS
ncbi:MAG: hypothetical protein WAM28_05605 [Chlamydiales bacterium]